MKILKRLLLIHWHYFTHEIIEFDKLNFLTGKNASGKSTIIDAMQLILLGDSSGGFFNKAASGRGNRTLIGYLMGELGDDEDAGFRYIRQNKKFASYIALEFYDEDKKRFFTVGCCFDVYSENDYSRLFFIYNGELHPQGFMENRTPLDILGLRTFLKEQYSGHFETTNVGRDFRTKLYGRLGGLRERFAGLLKKAVSFNPNVDIQEFISDFVCDNQEVVDVSHMQENIRSYKRLEHEASILHEKIDILEQIVETYEKYKNAYSSEMLYAFLVVRAKTDMTKESLSSSKEECIQLKNLLDALHLKIVNFEENHREIQAQREELLVEYKSDKAVQTKEKIESQLREKEQRIRTLTDEYEKGKSVLLTCISSWKNHVGSLLQKVNSLQDNSLDAVIHSLVIDISQEGQNLLDQLKIFDILTAETINEIGGIGLSSVAEFADNLRTRAIELNLKISDEKSRLSKQRGELTDELKHLESGFYSFPQDVIDLKEAVSSRLRVIAHNPVNVRIVAEVAEIRSDRWRNVIEGYLNTQKYYIIVPHEYFREAISVFDTIKKSKSIYGTGIIDIEKLRKLNPVANAGSLAEEITTNDVDAGIFLDYSLGRVQKCDNVRQLRNHQTAITDEGMLYQNFVVSAMNPKRWSKPAIGQGAILQRIDAVKVDLEQVGIQLVACSVLNEGLNSVRNTKLLSSAEIERIVTTASEFFEVSDLESALSSLKVSLDALDMAESESLKARIDELQSELEKLKHEMDNDREKRGEVKKQLQHLAEESIPKLEIELENLENEISFAHDSKWIDEIGMLRYTRELNLRGSASKIFDAFPREQSRMRNNKDNAWENLKVLRQSYNDRYKMGLDINASTNDIYDNAWLELNDNKLPEYQTRISNAKSKAFEQFQEDFISRLQNNINNAKRQIKELNKALEGAKFGEDTYQFKVLPRPDYRRFHDMIVDEMITQGGYNLLSLQFYDKYKEEIAELFDIITNENNTSGGVFEYEKRVQEFTDFRTYLSFDLESIGHDGESQRLSKTIGKKSGGETQTPFYIAVLASFAQLYRTGRDKSHKTSRLIIFDEAFSKMDGERIIRSIELLRKFDFQVILSAPPDKIGDIAILVDRNLCVLRNGLHTCVRSFDPKQAEGYTNE